MIKKVSLNGQWDFVADLDPKYHEDAGIDPKPAYARQDANRRHWRKVPVPGVWQKYGERYEIFEGVCWFAREFELQGYKAGTPAHIRFGAVNYYCRVFLNGEEIGQHETGYTEFTVNASNYLKDGLNHIAVFVDNRATTTKWPTCLGYFNYGGIHRDVTLEIMEGACLEDVVLNGACEGNTCKLIVSGRASMSEQGDDVLSCTDSFHAVHAEISCNSRNIKAEINADGIFITELMLPGTKPWSPEEPDLYPVSVKLMAGAVALDTYEVQYGFKDVKLQNGKVHINREPVALKGICYVYDSSITGLVMTSEQIETDVKLMKEMGCNAVRCHYPMDKKLKPKPASMRSISAVRIGNTCVVCRSL